VKATKYIGVTLDGRRYFTDHVKTVSGKAVKTVAALSRLMPNTGGPCQSKRRLLMAVANSTLLYAAPAWARAATASARNRILLIRSQRQAALRITRSYRTVSDAAALLLADTPPVDLLAEERAQVTPKMKSMGTEGSIKKVKEEERK